MNKKQWEKLDTVDKWAFFEDDDSTFDEVEPKRSGRKDIHAFILLDALFPGKSGIIGAAEHDRIWLSMTAEQVDTLSYDQILELTRCGVSYDEDLETLSISV
jgi:hypothetical protein